ncbi:helix-hairpin-helix domain-containing protein [Mitsuokella sp.]|uniref:helix-hairpin-helix domain-containing protein n=1 Tax=Mitsuokella sp. TaxID=2049034 RepID=UPI003D7E6DED
MPMYRKSLLILLLIVAAVAGGTYYGCYTQDKETIQLDAAAGSSGTQQDLPEVTVYVTGAVNKPGVVTVRDGARTMDAVNACGGLLPTADSGQINMAQVLKDGQQVRIPEKKGESAAANKQTAGQSSAKNAAAAAVVNINTASAEELDTLPGIGPAMAKRIIEYRETEGSFAAPEDLKKVRGIGEAKFRKLKDKICI